MEQRYIAGDWVIDIGINPLRPVQIAQVRENLLLFKEGWGTTDLSKVKPIPLTPEILEESGWKKWTYSSSKGQYTILAKDFDDNVSRTTVMFYKQVIKAEVWHSGYHLGIYLSYVHQLQHLLFGLGLDFDFDLGNSKKGGEK